MEAFYVLGGMLAVLIAVYFIYDIVERNLNNWKKISKKVKAFEATPEHKDFEKAKKAYEEAKKAEKKAWKALEETPEWKAYADAGETYWKGIELWAESVAHAYSEREE